jgi:hypothetical protein
MTPEQLDRFISALHVWAENHPYGDEPLITIGTHSYTPKELVKEVDARTPVGFMHLRVIDYALQTDAENMDSILSGLRLDGKWHK